VRNGAGGSTVEVVAEGPETSLRALQASLREGPRHARVDSIDATWSDALGEHAGFDVRG